MQVVAGPAAVIERGRALSVAATPVPCADLDVCHPCPCKTSTIPPRDSITEELPVTESRLSMQGSTKPVSAYKAAPRTFVSAAPKCPRCDKVG